MGKETKPEIVLYSKAEIYRSLLNMREADIIRHLTAINIIFPGYRIISHSIFKVKKVKTKDSQSLLL